MKYAPANTSSEKPYVVEFRDWNRTTWRVVYAENASAARYLAIGRKRPGVYVISCRRATVADMEGLP